MPVYNPPIYNFISGNVKGSDVAFSHLTTGIDNIALGSGVMEFITSGSENVGVGNYTLSFITTGIDNIAIGANTLNRVDIGSYNVGVGVNALINLTSGGQNVALGNKSSQSLYTGYNNTSIGYESLRSNRLGYDNISVGRNTLAELGGGTSDGIGNTALGSYALNNLGSFGSVNSDYNIAIGRLSGSSLVNGSYNVIIGSYSGALFNNNNNQIGISDGQGNLKLWFFHDPNQSALNSAQFYSGIKAGTYNNTMGASNIYSGTGAPDNAKGDNGAFYLNSTGGALTTIYQKRAGVWVGIV